MVGMCYWKSSRFGQDTAGTDLIFLFIGGVSPLVRQICFLEMLPVRRSLIPRGTFSVRQGPIFSNIVLADEINRAPAKFQAALLEAMQEKQVTLGDQTFQLPKPFLVMATKNPLNKKEHIHFRKHSSIVLC